MLQRSWLFTVCISASAGSSHCPAGSGKRTRGGTAEPTTSASLVSWLADPKTSSSQSLLENSSPTSRAALVLVTEAPRVGARRAAARRAVDEDLKNSLGCEIITHRMLQEAGRVPLSTFDPSNCGVWPTVLWLLSCACVDCVPLLGRQTGGECEAEGDLPAHRQGGHGGVGGEQIG